MKQAVIERMEGIQISRGVPDAGNAGHRVHRMTREVQIATYQPAMLRIFTVGLMIVFTLAMLL